MNNKPLSLGADTRPTKKVVHGLTKDITTEACIFDLIDNSIDAYKKADSNQLLESYRNYEISLEINSKYFHIKDDGGGITRDKLEKSALRFGAIDSRGISIGVFGVGLNRALFKLGKEFKITTETSIERISVTLNAEQYLANDDWHIPIVSEALINKTGTLIEITSLTEEASIAFSSLQWGEDFLSQLEKRYEIFLKKGLLIKVNEKYIAHREINIREGDLKLLHENFESDGVKIEIMAGQHHLHKFTYEDKSAENINGTLTKDYGWIVYCNDRAVLFSDTTIQTGCEGGFHSQYYGFVGKAIFVGESQYLPWNTTKTGVDLNNKVYSKALEKMKSFYGLWKSHTASVKKGKFDPSPQMPLEPVSAPTPSSSSDQNTKASASTPNTNEGVIVDPSVSSEPPASPSGTTKPMYNVPSHPLAQEYLFGKTAKSRLDFKIPSSEKKLLAVVNEISGLRLADNPFAIALLLRVLIELSLKSFQAQNGNQPQFSKDLALCQKIERCTDYMKTKNLLSDGHQITAIKSLCDKRGTSTITIEYLQNTIHGNTSMLPADGLLAFWNDIHPFVRACFSGIK